MHNFDYFAIPSAILKINDPPPTTDQREGRILLLSRDMVIKDKNHA